MHDSIFASSVHLEADPIPQIIAVKQFVELIIFML